MDISAQRPKLVSDVPLGDVDTVITLCAEECPLHSGRELRRETWSLPDPTKVRAATRSSSQRSAPCARSCAAGSTP